jgi:hypothetical protein
MKVGETENRRGIYGRWRCVERLDEASVRPLGGGQNVIRN